MNTNNSRWDATPKMSLARVHIFFTLHLHLHLHLHLRILLFPAPRDEFNRPFVNLRVFHTKRTYLLRK